MSQGAEFDFRRHLEGIVSNALSQLQAQPEERRSEIVPHFFAILDGATIALVAAGVVTGDEARVVKRQVEQPLFDTGLVSRVETSFSASVVVGVDPQPVHRKPPPLTNIEIGLKTSDPDVRERVHADVTQWRRLGDLELRYEEHVEPER